MRLRQLELYQVGRHHGTILRELGDGLTVVYGPNEAGKSTLLAGLRGLLFGKLTAGEPLLALEPGARARAQLESADNGRVAVERPLNRKSSVKLTLEDGTVLMGDAPFRQAFPELSRVEDYIYQSVFTFQLGELEDFANSPESLQSRIYAVGSLGGLAPAVIERRLADEAKELYSSNPRAKKPALVKCLADIRSLRQALVRASDTPSSYGHIQDQLANLQEQRAAAEEKRDGFVRALKQVERDLLAWPVFQRWQDVNRQLTSLETLTLPSESDVETFRTCTAVVEQLEETCQASAARLDSLRSEILPMVISKPLVLAAPDLQDALQTLTRIEMNLERQEELDATATRLAHEVQLRRKEWDTSWSDREILETDTSRSVFQQVVCHKEQMKEIRQAVNQQAAILAQHEAKLRVLADKWTDPVVDVHETERMEARRTQLEQAVHELQDEVRTLERCQALAIDLAAVQAEAAAWQDGDDQVTRLQNRFVAGLWGLVGLLLLFSVYAYVSAGVGPGIGGGLMTAVLAVWVQLWRARSGRAQASGNAIQHQELRRLSAEERRIMEQLTSLAGILKHTRLGDLDPKSVQDAHKQMMDRREDLRGTLDVATRLLELSRDFSAEWDLAQSATHIWQQRKQEEAKTLDAWRKIWETLGHSGECPSPDEYEETLHHVRRLQDIDSERAEHLAQYRQIEEETTTGLRVMGELLAALEPEQTEDRSESAAGAEVSLNGLRQTAHRYREQVGQWLNQATLEVAKAAKKQQLEHQFNLEESRLAQDTERFQRERETLRDFLSRFGVAGAEEFGDLVRLGRERVRLRQTLREMQIRLEGVMGVRIGDASSLKHLDDTSEEALESQKLAYQAQITRLNELLESLLRDIWSLEDQLASWQDGPTASNLTWQLSLLETERDTLAEKWVVATVARAMLNKAKTHFERDRQPEALHQAALVFHDITNGRYVRLFTRTDEGGKPSLWCTDADGEDWQLPNLSRGTREQVYLALRIALLQSYLEQGITLPMVLDDPMVNFDATRMQAFMGVLQKYAAGGQMIYLTCHEHVVRTAQQMFGIHTVNLADQAFL